jgi:hypothetical protein
MKRSLLGQVLSGVSLAAAWELVTVVVLVVFSFRGRGELTDRLWLLYTNELPFLTGFLLWLLFSRVQFRSPWAAGSGLIGAWIWLLMDWFGGC